MSDVLPYVAAALLVIIWWVVGLRMLDVFTPDDVRAWRRLGGLRGYLTVRGRLERAAAQSPWIRRLRASLDIDTLLATALREQTPVAFLVQTASIVLVAFAVLFSVDAAGRALSGQWPLAPWLPLALALLLAPLAVVELRGAATRTRREVARTLTDMTMMLAVLTDTRGFQLDDAVRMLSRCGDSPAAARLLSGGYHRLVTAPHTSTIDLYRRIATAYGVPELRMLADAAVAANAGIAEQQVYTGVAVAMYHERLADARVRAARARVLITLPVAGMLVPLLLLIGAPTLSALTGGLQ